MIPQEEGVFPPGWTVATIGDLAVDVRYGTSAKCTDDDSGVPVIRMGNIVGGELKLDDLRYLPREHHEFPELLLSPTDLLFNRTNSAELVGKTAVFRGQLPNCSFASYLIRVRLGAEVSPDFVAYYLNSPQGRLWVASVASQQVGQANVNGTKLKACRLPVAPATEQKRISREIDSYFTRLNDVTASVECARANLKRYRASVLRAAVEGRLVPTEAELARQEGREYEPASILLDTILDERRRRWESAERQRGSKRRYEEPVGPDLARLPTLPEGWCWTTTAQLTTRITSGSRDWSPYYDRGDATFIMAQNVRPGLLDLSPRQAVDPPRDDPSCARSQVNRQDLLVTIVGANTGDVCRVPEELPDHYVCQSVALMRPVELGSARFMELYLNSPQGRKAYETFMYGQGRPHLSFEQLGATPIPLPPFAEHGRIGREVDRLLSIEHESGAVAENSIRRVEKLRQSILGWAFEGKLVDQDPNDEPASVVLERIALQRQSMRAQRPKRRRKTSGLARMSHAS